MGPHSEASTVANRPLDWINDLTALPDDLVRRSCSETPNRPAINAQKPSEEFWKGTNLALQDCTLPFQNYKDRQLDEDDWALFEKDILKLSEDVYNALSSFASRKGSRKPRRTQQDPAIAMYRKKIAIVCKIRREIAEGLKRTPVVSKEMRKLLISIGKGQLLDVMQKHPTYGTWKRAHKELGHLRNALRKKKWSKGRSLTRNDNAEARKRNIFLWFHKRGVLYRNMLDSDMPTPTEEIFDLATQYYAQENESRNKEDFDANSIPEFIRNELPFTTPQHEDDYWEVTTENVCEYLKTANLNAAAGWDGIPMKVWARLPNTIQAMTIIFEVCRTNNRIPIFWQTANSILLAKKPVLKEGKDLRPIMLQCSMYKVYSGVLGRKIHDFAKRHGIWSDEQRGFTNVNGTLLNLFLLRFARENYKRRQRANKNLFALFVDVQNAFGAVEYKQLIAIMFGLGFPRSICEVVWSILKGGAMRFSFEGKTVDVLQKRGVKQGDPMSPIIFNLMTEPMWRVWRRYDIGYRVIQEKECEGDGEARIRPLGFADDMAILESDKGRLTLATNLLVSYFNWLSMKLVPSKCGLLKLQTNATKAGMEDDWTVNIDGKAVQVINSKRFAPEPNNNSPANMRYLGNWFNAQVRCHEGMDKLIQRSQTKLDKLTNVELPLRYKFAAINQWITDAAVFSLATERVSIDEVEKIQVLIWKAIRAWCKLPHNAALDVLTLPWERHGMNLHHVRTLYEVTIARKYEFLVHAKEGIDRTAKELAMVSLQDSASYRKFEGNFVGHDDVKADRPRTFWSVAHQVALKYKLVDHMPDDEIQRLVYKETCRHVNQLGEQGEIPKTWKSLNCLKFWIKAYLQLLPTKAYRARFAPVSNPIPSNCEVCGPQTKETQHHVLNGCPHRAANMLIRHNRVQDALLPFIPSTPGETRFINKHIPSYHYVHVKGMTHDKPDIVILSHLNKEITIIEIAVPYDRRIVASTQQKIEKYELLAEAMKRKYPEYDVKIVPIVIGSLGGFTEGLHDSLYRIGVKKEKIFQCTQKLMDAAVTGSQWIWNRRRNFCPYNDFSVNQEH
eukprot:TRINITY_DN199_c1_g1_i11.p1 TRINITY_DN199_c1_g1~~TRINITY_DN199_c1_g1_i11.p1  ORF type:complete len:1067 (+),score=94.52 TRINITY_DN199_c1_g1_i11:650-3850(+)